MDTVKVGWSGFVSAKQSFGFGMVLKLGTVIML